MTDWINKAKEAAKAAADEAKKLAESAKNVNYGEMFDKTKNLASHAADEAKKAAGMVMHSQSAPTTPEITPNPDGSMPTAPTAQTGQATPDPKTQINAKLDQIAVLLNEIKQLLK